ncbi:MAG: FG-GAP-like repeat-containing protein [Candidatus Dormibacter sp.]
MSESMRPPQDMPPLPSRAIVAADVRGELVAIPAWRRCSLLVGITLAIALVPGTAHAADWPTFHGDNTRQGNDSSDPGLASPNPRWTSAQFDGKVYGQPVVLGGQVIVATENNTVYSLSAVDGSVQWHRNLGAPRTSNFPCGNINPLGITGTPVVHNGVVFVAAEVQTGPTAFTFKLESLGLGDGHFIRALDLKPPDSQFDANVEQQRGALMVAAGRVFVPLGGMWGDCGNYHGYVLSYAETGTGTGTLQWWASTEVDPSNREGGAWAAGGMSQDAGGSVYVSTGNSNHTSSGDQYDYSDAVIKFDPTSISPGAPLDYFAPSNWFNDNAGDVDLGSTTPLQLPGNRTFIVGKSGNGYLLNNASLGGIGHQLVVHRVCSATNDAVFGSLAYANGVVYVPCRDGLTAVGINGTSTDFAVNWHNSTDVVDHPPTVAGGLIWAVTPDGGTLLGFNTSGQKVHSFAIGGSTHFATPTAANGQLYVAANNVVEEFGGCGGLPLVGDFTGDGKADVVSVGPGGTCVLPSTGTSFTTPMPWSNVPFFGRLATLPADVTGDGKSDLVAVNASSTWVLTSTGSAFSGPQPWSATPFAGQRATLAGSLTLNGQAALIAVNDTSAWVMPSNGSGFGAPQKWSSVPFYGTRATLAADVNGDGRVDLIAVDDTSTWVMLNTGSSFSAPQLWSNVPFFGSRATLAGAVNLSRKADLLAITDTATWVMTSNGSAFSAPQPWSSAAFFGSVATLGGDVTGDARMDLVAVNPTATWVMSSNGSAFNAPMKWWDGYP